MYSHKKNFFTLSKELELFTNKYYSVAFVKGFFQSGLFGIGVLLGVLSLEHFFRFSSIIRGFLFFGSSFAVLGFFTKNSVVPLLKRWRLLERFSHQEVAVLLSEKIPSLKDHLVNAIGLEKQNNTANTDLLAASIEKKSLLSLEYDFLSSVSFADHKKFILYVVGVFFISAFCSWVYPEAVLSPLKRVVLFQNSFEEPNPFFFSVNNNENLVVMEGDPLKINIKTIGPIDPEEIFLFVDNQRFFPIKIKKNNFTHNFSSVKSNFNFTLVDGRRDSVFFMVNVLPKARIISEKKVVNYPSYTQLESDTFYDLNSLVLPEGTSINWEIKFHNTENCNIRFKDTTFKGNQNPFVFTYIPKTNQNYLISAKNTFSNYKDSTFYNIELIKDQYPKIFVKDVLDSNDIKKHLFYGEISDDYGFTSLSFLCKNKDSIVFEKQIDFEKGSRSVFSLEMDFKTLGIKAGDFLEHYFVVKDNDGVNGPKKTLSKKMFFRAPSKKQLKDLDKIKSESQNKSFSSLQKKMLILNSELNEIKSTLLNKKSLNWEDKSSLENFLKGQKKLQKDLEQLKNNLKKELDKDQANKSEEILKKQEQINKMVEELMSDEMKKLLDELGQLAQEMNKEKVLDKLDDIDFSQENMLKELDRTIEHFKKIELEKMANDIAVELKNLAKKQEELAEKTMDKEVLDFKKNQEQEKIKEAFNEIQNDLFDLENKNNELTNPENINTEEKENAINKSIEKSINELSDNKHKKAKEQQSKSSEGMKDLAEAMEKLGGGSGSEQAEEDLESLRTLLEHLISFSLEQEEVLAELKNTRVQDPKYIHVGQGQRKLNDEIDIIEDSLTALGLRQIMLSSKINKEVQTIKRSLRSSIKSLTERQTKNAQIEQQNVMMHTNELGLLLSELMNQMQSNMPGSGQCNKPGGKNKKPGNGLPKSAEQMKKQIEAMKRFLEDKKAGKNNGKTNSPFEQLGRMAAEQAALKKQLLEMVQEINKDGSGKGNGLKEIIKKIEEVENDIIENNISLSSIERQEEIKIKMLELDKASKEQEEEEKRESKESLGDYKKNNSVLFEDYLKLKKGEIEMLKTIPNNLKPYYKNKVNDYIKSIEKNYD